MPAWMKPIVYINPLSYGIDVLRTLIIGVSTFSLWVDFLVLILASAFMMALGSRAFKARM
jgi:ABC-2 type transport system permease protein